MENIYNLLLSEVNKIKIIDTHEHLDPHNSINEGAPADVLSEYLMHFIHMDLLSSGMSMADYEFVRNPAEDIEIRYAVLEPHLEYVRSGSFFRVLERAASIIHGVESIDRNTIWKLNEKFVAATANPNYGEYIMKDICNIEAVINHFHNRNIRSVKTDLFFPVFLPERTILNDKPTHPTLDDFLESYREEFQTKIKDGAVAVKLLAAYARSLYFKEVDRKTASELYLKHREKDKQGNFPLPLQDYIYHHIFKCADEMSFPVQIHTGLQGVMGGNLLNSNPMLLQNLFGKYKNVAFNLFHMGYPYERELMVLTKTHANVYLDMCWAHAISPYASRAAFSEMLDVLPYNKIFAFGADYAFYDGVAGSLSMANENVCTVLAGKIARGEMTEDMGVRVLNAVFRENAIKAFHLDLPV